MVDFKEIKNKKIKQYFIDNKILSIKELKKKQWVTFPDICNMINEGIDISNIFYKYKKHIAYFQFGLDFFPGDYAYVSDNTIYFDIIKGCPEYITSWPRSYDIQNKYKTIFKTGSVKLLKQAIFESFIFSISTQCLLLQSDIDVDKYLEAPICFYDRLWFKQKYQDYDFLMELIKKMGFKQVADVPKRWDIYKIEGGDMPSFVKE